MIDIATWNRCTSAEVPLFTAIDVGWKDTPFSIYELVNFLYQESELIRTDTMVSYNANYTNAGPNRYLALRYPNYLIRFNNWVNTIGWNYGITIPDQVFDIYRDSSYFYIYSIVKPALDPVSRIIQFS